MFRRFYSSAGRTKMTRSSPPLKWTPPQSIGERLANFKAKHYDLEGKLKFLGSVTGTALPKSSYQDQISNRFIKFKKILAEIQIQKRGLKSYSTVADEGKERRYYLHDLVSKEFLMKIGKPILSNLSESYECVYDYRVVNCELLDLNFSYDNETHFTQTVFKIDGMETCFLQDKNSSNILGSQNSVHITSYVYANGMNIREDSFAWEIVNIVEE
jgi:hypothetical protein